jgi:hypothetical protein
MSAGEGEADDTVGAGVPEDSSVFTEGTDIQDYVCTEVMTARVFVERRPIRGRNRRSSLNCERVAEDLVRSGDEFAAAQCGRAGAQGVGVAERENAARYSDTANRVRLIVRR